MIRCLEEIRGVWGLRHTPFLCNRLTLVPWRPSLAAHTVLRCESPPRPHPCDWRFPRRPLGRDPLLRAFDDRAHRPSAMGQMQCGR